MPRTECASRSKTRGRSGMFRSYLKNTAADENHGFGPPPSLIPDPSPEGRREFDARNAPYPCFPLLVACCLCLYSVIFSLSSRYSRQEKKQSLFRVANCSSAFVKLPVSR